MDLKCTESGMRENPADSDRGMLRQAVKRLAETDGLRAGELCHHPEAVRPHLDAVIQTERETTQRSGRHSVSAEPLLQRSAGK